MVGHDYTHSTLDADGFEYITFMTEPPMIDCHGMRNARAIDIHIDHRKNITKVYSFRWVYGYPRECKLLKTLKDETITDSEVPMLLQKLGIEIIA